MVILFLSAPLRRWLRKPVRSIHAALQRMCITLGQAGLSKAESAHVTIYGQEVYSWSTLSTMSESEATAGVIQWHSLLPDDEADEVGAEAIQVAWEVQYAVDLLWTSVRFRVRTTKREICITRAVFSVWIGADTDEPGKLGASVSIDYLPGMLLQEYQEVLTLPHIQLDSSNHGHALLSLEGRNGDVAAFWTGRNKFEWSNI